MIVDTHAHLADHKLSSDIENFLEQARQANVLAMLSIGTNVTDSKKCIELAEQHSQIRAAVGIHPNVCCQAESGDWAIIEELCQHPRVAALGETGLDKHWDDCPWEVQLDYFGRHIELSRKTQLPVVIHTRDCAQETLDFLTEQRQQGPLLGVMHSFTGPREVSDACLELGLYISFAGMVTFKNGVEISDIARDVPLDRILVETDSPYLTPHPFRGKRPNHPALVAHTLEHIARVRGMPASRLAEHTTANAIRLFGPW